MLDIDILLEEALDALTEADIQKVMSGQTRKKERTSKKKVAVASAPGNGQCFII